MTDILAALIPSIGVGFLFYVVIRAILQADRRERAAQRELDASSPDSPDSPPNETQGDSGRIP